MSPKVNKEKDAEEVSQLDFMNLASHQLRTPLSGMKWLLELLQKNETGSLNTKQKGFLEQIYSSNERMIALVNDLLEVLKIEDGQAKVFLTPTDISPVIHALMKEKEKEIKAKKLSISISYEVEPFPNVKTEPNKIKQALNNIISNAIAFTPDGGKISIDLKKEGVDNILISIKDTGLGIPKSQQKDIFKRFFRGSNTKSMEKSGTGLGLYIAKAFIESSGGKIWFKSQEGKGTTFFITLPIVK